MIKKSTFVFFFFLFPVLISITINSGTVSCTPHEVAAIPPPAPLQTNTSVHQLSNIIDALIGTTDFTNWTSIDPSIFPITATLFVPDDSTLFSSPLPNVDPFMFAYHVVPQCLAFSELRLFEVGSRLPTLIPDKYILITSNSNANFTLDNSRLTRPDLFSTDSIVLHGIASILDYKAYGDIPDPKSEARNPKGESAAHMTKNTTDTINATGVMPSLPLPPREHMIGGEQTSCAAYSCCKFKTFLVLAWFCLNMSSWIQDLRSTFI